MVKGVKFEIIFPAGKVDAGRFFTVNQVCFPGMCMLSMLRVHGAALAESLQAERCHRLPHLDVAGAQTASQPTVVIRGGGRGYYTLVRLAAPLPLYYDALTCFSDVLDSDRRCVRRERTHNHGHVVSANDMSLC